jgi:transposase
MIRKKRNWSQYNDKLRNFGRIDFFVSEEVLQKWNYIEKRKRGGKQIYSNYAIEIALILRELYKIAYRQTEGFISSIFKLMRLDLSVPDYTTIARRAKNLPISLRCKEVKDKKEGIVIAVDSTGLSIYSRSEWCQEKHGGKKLSPNQRWKKLHVCIDVETGEIIGSAYTDATVNDGEVLPEILEQLDSKVVSGSLDMAYDTYNCRKALIDKGAKQIIPPKKNARLSKDNRNIKSANKAVLKERDDAINFIRYNTINGDTNAARKYWKEKVGYHSRSLVETTMYQIKSHTSDVLTNRREDTRKTQALIKCKIVNMMIAA